MSLSRKGARRGEKVTPEWVGWYVAVEWSRRRAQERGGHWTEHLERLYRSPDLVGETVEGDAGEERWVDAERSRASKSLCSSGLYMRSGWRNRQE